MEATVTPLHPVHGFVARAELGIEIARRTRAEQRSLTYDASLQLAELAFNHALSIGAPFGVEVEVDVTDELVAEKLNELANHDGWTLAQPLERVSREWQSAESNIRYLLRVVDPEASLMWGAFAAQVMPDKQFHGCERCDVELVWVVGNRGRVRVLCFRDLLRHVARKFEELVRCERCTAVDALSNGMCETCLQVTEQDRYEHDEMLKATGGRGV